jgi:hypothetical protein
MGRPSDLYNMAGQPMFCLFHQGHTEKKIAAFALAAITTTVCFSSSITAGSHGHCILDQLWYAVFWSSQNAPTRVQPTAASRCEYGASTL